MIPLQQDPASSGKKEALFLVVALLLLTPTMAWSQGSEPSLRLVADLEDVPQPVDLAAGQFITMGDEAFFTARGSQVGSELWRSDGTSEGTDWMSDLCPGACDSGTRVLATDGSRLLLGLREQLWISDGTDAGTLPITVPCSDCVFSTFQGGKWNGEVFLFEVYENSRFHPWVTDGTAAGTLRLDLQGRRLASSLSPGKTTYFAASGAGGETWLYTTDGTAEGTLELKSLCEHCGTGMMEAVELGEQTIFTTYSLETGWRPWVTDGTPQGTRLLAELPSINVVSAPRDLVVVGNEAFGMYPAGCGQECFFRTDGTPEGTRTAPELFPLTVDGHSSLELAAAGSTLYGKFWNLATGHQELWALGGPGGMQFVHSEQFIGIVGEALGALYFYTSTGADKVTYVTEGSPSTTRALLDLELDEVLSLGDVALLETRQRHNASTFESRLWRSDGTVQGTSELSGFNTPLSDSRPEQLQPWRQGVAWVTGRPFNQSVWSLDDEGLRQLAADRRLGRIVPTTERLFFNDYGLGAIRAVAADGTEDSFTLNGSFATEMFPWNDQIFASASERGQALWRSGGSQEQTQVVIDVNPDWFSGCPIFPCFPSIFPRDLDVVAGRLMFSAFENEDGPGQLWSTDGTPEGSSVVAEFTDAIPGGLFDVPQDLVSTGPLGFFRAVDTDHGLQLWVTDGTGAGTRRLTGDETTPAGSDLTLLTPWGERLAMAERSVETPRIWLSDGGPPTVVAELSAGSRVLSIAAGEQRLFWVADSPEYGRELWHSDGTAEGTRVLDVYPGVRGSGAASVTPFEGGVFFAADAGNGSGHEPWVWVEGTAKAQQLVDLSPGREPSSPGPGLVANDELFFPASDGVVGRELFAFDWSAAGLFCPEDKLCFFDRRFEVSLRWQTAGGASGDAQRAATGGDSGLFWFFDADNWESMVKVLDGCGINGYYWVFAATSSDVGFTLRVNDTVTGASRTWTNAPGQAAPAITEVEAFPCSAP